MKFLLFIAFAAGLLILERPIIFGETVSRKGRLKPEPVFGGTEEWGLQ